MIADLFQMNDWEIKKFLRVVLALQLAMLGLIGLSAFGFDIPILRQVVGFIYLTLIPGLILLRILKLHQLGWVETLLYSVGLSLAFIMFLGLFVNLVYPHIGIDKPISTWPLLGTMTVVLLILSFVAYKRDKGFSVPTQFDGHQLLSPPVLFLTLLPLLSVLGTQLVNLYHNNILLLILIPLIALVPLLIVFTNFIPQRLYPLAVVAIAVSLLYHSSLISSYLPGWDIHTEYYLANLVKTNSFWYATTPHSYNAMLSIVIQAPTYSIICGLELTWVFKIIYPLLFSLVPLGIYRICRRQINEKIAFLAAFLFMSVITFYTDMNSLARQQVAEVFLVLIVMAIVTKSMNPLKRTILCLIFGASIVVSHYSISYIFMLSLIFLLFILFLSRRIPIHGPPKSIESASALNRQQRQIAEPDSSMRNRGVTIGFTAFFAVVCLSWYIWQSGSSAFVAMVRLTDHIASTFSAELLSLTSSQALWMITTPTVSPLHEITKYLHLFIQFLIAVGMLNLLLRWRQKAFDEEFAAFSLFNFLLIAAAIPVPYLAIALNTTRLYHLTLIFLAPFCITGAIAISRFLFRRGRITEKTPLRAISVILAIFLLFNTGFVYQIAKDHPISVSLSQEWIKTYGDADEKAFFYGNYTPEEDVFSARWLSANVENIGKIKVYATYWTTNSVYTLESYGMIPISKVVPLESSTQEVESGAYIYLQYLNVVEGIGTMVVPPFRQRETFNILELNQVFEKANRIYSSQGSKILLVP